MIKIRDTFAYLEGNFGRKIVEVWRMGVGEPNFITGRARWSDFERPWSTDKSYDRW